MACFVAPAATVAAISIVKKKIPEKYHADWLILMLLGGVLMLLVDHIASGEVISRFPFFTRSWSGIWPEILRVGVPMTILVFASWILMILGAAYTEKRRNHLNRIQI